MNDTTLDEKGEAHGSHWVRRTLLVVFSLGLFALVGVMFTQVIAARVPEQRATLEKLIADRTGLQVRFENVHFSWGLDGTRAVFERVELVDPERGRVRVIAPELRVEFDTWDFIRHQQFSLGHVTLSSPDIDIIAEPEAVESTSKMPAAGATRAAAAKAAPEDERAMIRHFTAWAELMPVGKVEVEGARVHLFRRGERTARHDFSLSQAVINRGVASFDAFGTLLLSQDVGQSLFVSAKLTGMESKQGASGELRVIARRVQLDKLPWLADRGRGTVDVKITLADGRVSVGNWQLSGRELDMPNGQRFDHFTVKGELTRAQDDVLLDLRDLQVTRDARLERAPRIQARLTLAPGSWRVAHTTLTAERIPFMAAELLVGTLAPDLDQRLPAAPDWTPEAGELHDVRFDSRTGAFGARVTGATLRREVDNTRLARLDARIDISAQGTRLTFEDSAFELLLPGATEPRQVQLAGALVLGAGDAPEWQFAGLRLHGGDASLQVDGNWSDGARVTQPLTLELAQVDRALLGDMWTLLALDGALPQLSDVQQGRIVTGKLNLLPAVDRDGRRTVNWQRSRGLLELADLASITADSPGLEAGAGTLDFSRGNARLQLKSGRIEDLQLTDVRVDWPRTGEPRLRAALQGDLQSPLLRRTFGSQGLERLTGAVALDAEARGETALRNPDLWRVSARVTNGAIPLAPDLPAVEKLSGTARVANGQLRALSLQGSWLGGPVTLESRRAGARGVTSADLSGVAEAASLLQLLGHAGAEAQLTGQVAWSGSLQRNESDWQVTLNSNLTGLESRLPEPFDKSRARALPVSAQLRFDERGIHEFVVEGSGDSLRGRVEAGVTTARFEWQDITGELRSSDEPGGSRLQVDRLDLKRAPLVLAAASALLPDDADLRVDVTELRHARRALGALEASLNRRQGALEFSLESATGSPHVLTANGSCAGNGADCRMDFRLRSGQLPVLLGDAELPAEWPTQSLDASGELRWRGDSVADITRGLSGNFDLETQGADSTHQLVAAATVADGQIDLADIQGTGPAPDQMFRGQGRVRLQARSYDFTVTYEKVALATTAVPTPARARLSRAWSILRGPAVKRGLAEPETARRVQWHGTWE